MSSLPPPPKRELKRRLVICLDGTWNNRDNSTNVLHHFALAFQGETDAGVTQTKYYHEGVGTGVLDGLTGGGLGLGLEGNVRDAYNWLVANYNDEDAQTLADEIYIFGFSRGAYTARSLVGFISTCGLLRRGAPLPVSELWDDYCTLGREREHRTSVWDRVFGEEGAKTRRITELICDPWNIQRFERDRSRALQAKGSAPDAGAARLPGQLVDSLNASERLLVRWSRRVRITYLGVYDTVGAMGIDALAIPGLRSRLALHHNMRATTLIQDCRHALALDEHRSSFSHTPFLEYIGHGDDQEYTQRNTRSEWDSGNHWSEVRAMWRRKVEQRWFVGAHSNIGGGYADNELAQLPFCWILEGAAKAGLTSEAMSAVQSTTLPPPRDSYAQFAKPLWTMIVRVKRYYRQVDPPPERKASLKKGMDKDETPPGFSMQSIHETIDPSVFRYARTVPDYRPPNLADYATRKLADTTIPPNTEELEMLATPRPAHAWLGASVAAHVVLLLWASCVPVGVTAMHVLFSGRMVPMPLAPLQVWLLGGVAFAMALVDWGESRAGFALALGPSSARWRAFVDSIYWVRSLGFVLFLVGATAALSHLWMLGWRADTAANAWRVSRGIIEGWWPVPLLAGMGVVVANALDRAPGVRQKSGLIGLALGSVVAIGGVPIVVLLGWLFERVFRPALGLPGSAIGSPAADARLAGLLLLLQIGTAYLVDSLTWATEPISAANLGGVFSLQRRATRGGVVQCLEAWRRMLARRWDPRDKDAAGGPAAQALHEILRESLWRDILGFIPLYSLTFAFGLWFAAGQLGWEWMAKAYFGVPLWLWLPLVAAVADYLEDVCHLRYVSLHERGKKPPAILPPVSFAMSALKFAAAISAGIVIPVAIVAGSLRIAQPGVETGWRGTVALLISVLAALAIVVIGVSTTVCRFRPTSLTTKALGSGTSLRVREGGGT